MIRPYKGTLKVAKRMRMLFKDSENIMSHEDCETGTGSIFHAMHSTGTRSLKKCLLPFKRID